MVAERPTPCSREPRQRVLARQRRDVELDEVRLDLVGVDGEPGLGEAAASRSRARVVVGEPLDVVVERVDAGGRDDPGLAHRAAEEVLLRARRAPDHLGRAGEHGAERAAEPLREAERDGVEAAAISAARPRSRRQALRRRAPSRWKREAELRRVRGTVASSSSGQTVRPSCCACSRSRAAGVRGEWIAGPRARPRTCSA